MDREEDRAEREGGPANLGAVPNHEDNTVPTSSAEAASSAEKLGRLVLDIARVIGRQMARDDYQCRTAVSDNRDLDGGGDDYVYGDDLTRTSRRVELSVKGVIADLLNLPKRKPHDALSTVMVVAGERFLQYRATVDIIC